MSEWNRNRYEMQPHNFSEKFGPKTPNHATVGHPCAKCRVPLQAGDYTALNPVDNYSVEVHWDCSNPKLKRKKST